MSEAGQSLADSHEEDAATDNFTSSKLSASRAAFQAVLKQAYQLYCSESEVWLTEVVKWRGKVQGLQHNSSVIFDRGRQYREKCDRLTEENRKLQNEVENLREKISMPCSSCLVYQKQLETHQGVYDKAYEALLRAKDEQISKLEDDKKKLKASRRRSRPSKTEDTQLTVNTELSYQLDDSPTQDTEYTETQTEDPCTSAPVRREAQPENDCVVVAENLQSGSKKQLKQVIFDESATQSHFADEKVSPGGTKDKLKLTRSGKRSRSRYSEEQYPDTKKARMSKVENGSQFVPKTPSQELMRPPPMPAIETPEATDKVAVQPTVLVPETCKEDSHDTLSDSDLLLDSASRRFNGRRRESGNAGDPNAITVVPETVPFDLDEDEDEEEDLGDDEQHHEDKEAEDERSSTNTKRPVVADRRTQALDNTSSTSNEETTDSTLPTQVPARPRLLHSPPSYASTPISAIGQDGTHKPVPKMFNSPIHVGSLAFDENSAHERGDEADDKDGLSVTNIESSGEESDASGSQSPVFRQRATARARAADQVRRSPALFDESGDKSERNEVESPTAGIIEIKDDEKSDWREVPGKPNLRVDVTKAQKQKMGALHDEVDTSDVTSPSLLSHRPLHGKTSEASPSVLSGKMITTSARNKPKTPPQNKTRLSRPKKTNLKTISGRATTSRILRSQSSQEDLPNSPGRSEKKQMSSPVGKLYITADSPGSKAKSKKLVQSKISAAAFKSPRLPIPNTSMTEQELKEYEEAVKRSLEDARRSQTSEKNSYSPRHGDAGDEAALGRHEKRPSTTKSSSPSKKTQAAKVTSPGKRLSLAGKPKRSTQSAAANQRQSPSKENSPFKKPRIPAKPTTPRHRHKPDDCVSPRRSPRLMRDLTNSPDVTMDPNSLPDIETESHVRSRQNRSRRSLQMDDTVDPDSTTLNVYTMALNGSIDPAAHLSQYDSHPSMKGDVQSASQYPAGIPMDDSIIEYKEKTPPKSKSKTKLRQSKITSLRVQPERSQKSKPSQSVNLVEDSGGDIDSSTTSVVFGPGRKQAVVRADIHSAVMASPADSDERFEHTPHDDSEAEQGAMSRPSSALLQDSFDMLPSKEAHPGFAYVEVVRKKAERLKLNAYTCSECEKYFSAIALSEEEKAERMKHCRHRARFLPPDTPEHFWSVGFPDTQECREKGYLNTTQHKPSKFRRKRGFKALFNADDEISAEMTGTRGRSPATNSPIEPEEEAVRHDGADSGEEDTSEILL